MAKIKTVRWWHEQIVDVMLKHPSATQRDIAAYFEVTESWLSSVINSDVFKAYHAGRRELHQSNISTSVIDRVEGLASKSMEVLEERIMNARESVPLPVVKETCEMALKALGFGGPQRGAGTNVQVNVGLVPQSVLEESRKKMAEKRQEELVDSVESVSLESIEAQEKMKEINHEPPGQSEEPAHPFASLSAG